MKKYKLKCKCKEPCFHFVKGVALVKYLKKKNMKFNKNPMWIIVHKEDILTLKLEKKLQGICAFSTRKEALEFKKNDDIKKGVVKKIKEIIV